MKKVKRKYIYYQNRGIYALYYKRSRTIYYNLMFEGKAQLIVIR